MTPRGPASARRPAVIAWRAGHALIAAGFLAAIAHVWRCALTGRRDRLLGVAVGALAVEGAVVAANGGDCPLGPLGEKVGDEVPLFNLVLPPWGAKLAVPALGAVAGLGVAIAGCREARSRGSAGSPHRSHR